MTKLCICQICVCGRHRCPHKSSREPFAKEKDAGEKFTSEMKQSYRCRPNQPKEKPVKPLAQLGPATGQMVKTSMTMDDYQPKKTLPRKMRSQPQYKPPETKMYSQTTYRKDYTPDITNRPGREPPIKRQVPNLKIPEGEKMECRTTQNRDYIAYDQKSADACRAKPVTYRGGTLTVLGQEFKGKSETMKSFKKPGQTERTLGTKKPDNLYTEGKFEGKATTTVDYPAKKCEARVKVKPKTQAMKWPDDVVKTGTTYKTDFAAYDKTSRTEPCGPRKTQIVSVDEPFLGRSMYKTDYPAHETPRRSILPWEPKKCYEKPTVTFANDTTYRKDFITPPEDLLTEKGKGLKTNLEVGSEPMATVTTHRNDYLPYVGYQPVQSAKVSTPFVPPSTPFADNTTTRHDFRGDSGKPATAIKRQGNLRPDTSPMDLVTMTSKDYTCRKMDCPAAKLKLGDKEILQQYQYLDSNRGHEFYQKLKPVRRKSN